MVKENGQGVQFGFQHFSGIGPLSKQGADAHVHVRAGTRARGQGERGATPGNTRLDKARRAGQGKAYALPRQRVCQASESTRLDRTGLDGKEGTRRARLG